MRGVKPTYSGRQGINTGIIYWFTMYMDLNCFMDYQSREKHKPEPLTLSPILSEVVHFGNQRKNLYILKFWVLKILCKYYINAIENSIS